MAACRRHVVTANHHQTVEQRKWSSGRDMSLFCILAARSKAVWLPNVWPSDQAKMGLTPNPSLCLNAGKLQSVYKAGLPNDIVSVVGTVIPVYWRDRRAAAAVTENMLNVNRLPPRPTLFIGFQLFTCFSVAFSICLKKHEWKRKCTVVLFCKNRNACRSLFLNIDFH